MLLPHLTIASLLFLAPGERPEGAVVHVDKSPPPVPERNIRRRFGEKSILEVETSPETDPAFFRYRCGFGAWAAGMDGVAVGEAPALADALAAAKDDAALLARLEDARVEALASSDLLVRLAGRKAGNFLANLDASEDPDLLHLEGMVVLRAAEAALGRDPTPLADTVRHSVAAGQGGRPSPAAAGQGTASRRYRRPPEAEMARWPAVNLRATIDQQEFAPGFVCNYSWQYRTLKIGVKGDRPLDKDEYPGGVAEITLWIPDKGPEGWLVYRARVDMEKPPEIGPPPESEGWAPDPCFYYYVHERRFPDRFPPASAHAFVTYSRSRPWGRAYPEPRFASASINRADGPWRMLYSFDLCSLPENLPMQTPGVQDVWFAEISYGGKTARARLVWPHGSEANVLAVYRGYPLETFWQKYPAIYEQEQRRWEWGDDDRFYRDFAAKVLKADARLLEMLKSWNGHPPAIAKEVPKVQLKFYRELPRVVFIRERLEEIRKRYLLDILEGREPVPPEIDAPTPEREAPAQPALDAEPLMDLDEEVF